MALKYERFSNLAATTLDGSIADSDTSIDVTDGSTFPSVGNFRIIIEDEIILVTARSSNTLTVVRGIENTSAASHADDTAVTHVVTAGGLAQTLRDNIPGYMSRPVMGIYDASGNIITASDFTVVNGAGASVSDDGGTISVLQPTHTGDNATLVLLAKPSTPYSIIMGFKMAAIGDGSCAPQFGPCLRASGSGVFLCLQIFLNGVSGWPNYQTAKFTDPTTFGSSFNGYTFTSNGTMFMGDVVWVKLTDDGTTCTFSISVNGITWIDFPGITEAGNISSPNQVGFYVSNTNNAGGLPLLVNCVAFAKG
jgi:hypothetical protein